MSINPFARKIAASPSAIKNYKSTAANLQDGSVIQLPSEQNVIVTGIRYADEHMHIVGTPLMIVTVKGYGGVFNNVETEFSMPVNHEVIVVGQPLPTSVVNNVMNPV